MKRLLPINIAVICKRRGGIFWKMKWKNALHFMWIYGILGKQEKKKEGGCRDKIS